jgi:hypothetical protein
MCALKNATLLPDVCCCLSNKGSEILFRINILPPLTTIAGLDGEGPWLDLTTMVFFLWGHIKALICMSTVDSDEDLIACITEAAVTTRPQPGIFDHTCQFLLCHCWLFIKVSGQMLKSALNWYEKQLFSENFSDFA